MYLFIYLFFFVFMFCSFTQYYSGSVAVQPLQLYMGTCIATLVW